MALVLSVLYFLTGELFHHLVFLCRDFCLSVDSSTEQVIKLYGITGSGSLAVVAFVIIFLDCCNDGDRDDHEEEAIYRILQFKEKKDEKAVKRQHRRVIIKKEEPSVGQPQRSQSLPKSLPPAHHHHHHYPQPSHIHHIHAHTSGFYHHPHSFSHYRYPYDAHHHHHHRHHQSDVGVDTSDRLETILKSKGTIRKPMRNAQTAPKTEDIEHGTQTSTTDFDGKSNNTLEIAKEIPAPEKTANPLPTLKEKSIEQPEKDFPITRTISELNPPLLPKV